MITAPQRHRWQRFATLYDPDAIELTPDVPEGKPDVLVMKLGKHAYQSYRRRLLERNPVCFYCRKLLDLTNSSLDHVIPECRGGSFGPGNLQLCCLDCNGSKGPHTPVEWLADLRDQIERLGDLANVLAERIEVEGLQDFQANKKKPEGKTGKAGHPSGPFEPTPQWHIARNRFQDGKAEYHIVSTDTRKTLIRGLKLQDAVHYFLEVGHDDSVSLVCVTPLYHKALGLSPALPKIEFE